MHVALGSPNKEAGCDVRLQVPLGYPHQAVSCSLAASAASRAWVDESTRVLQAAANSAAQEGQPFLHEVHELVLQQLALLELPSEQQPSTSAPKDHADSQGDAPVHVLLLRLDHMRNKGLYMRSLKGWASDLGLTGCVIFLCKAVSLILILIEGAGEDVREYLRRHRTESVDVDSRGRKCKERMMDVVAESDVKQRGFTNFKEVEVETLS
eukprot:CAMPEP_0202919582 /NCGR_PEP_ID=MMETSP1392-20130828/76183_1 /ASSEMBLY_ACC=CAM_ASM_000868 /TAXON_ID=225041 /ORGANISM="Chlamydomonas chlamydogama, Strain SAG 11-48b" /LENGTH=209 /DNA_ID=CAMNT_0049613001 /DNA_START=148 /DNA_END=774 /DNA_ORIENTATION=+